MIKKSLSVLLAFLMSISIVTAIPFYVHGEDASSEKSQATKEKTKNLNVGDIVEVGSYPQHRVLDANLISNLNKIGTSLKKFDYVGKYGDVDISYADVVYNGVKYRKTLAKEAMPECYGGNSNALYDYISENMTYKINEIYWFVYEPIKWKVISNNSDGVVLLSVTNIDTSMYSKTKLYQSWNESDLRSWLNDNFYSMAFNDNEKSMINSTNHYTPVNQTTNKEYDYATDKLWIPTVAEYESFDIDNNSCSAYARFRGYHDLNSWINNVNNYGRICTDTSGSKYSYYKTNNYNTGVRPVMELSRDAVINVTEKYKPTEGKKYYSGNYAYTLDENDQATLVEMFGEEEKVALPETVNGKTVVDIGEDILENDTNIKELTISDSVKKISCKFKSKTLETVHIGSGVEYINPFAFIFSTNIKNVYVSKDNTRFKDLDGVLCHYNTLLYYPVGRSDTSYTIPKNVDELQNNVAFLNANNLEKVYCTNDTIRVDYQHRSLGYSNFDTYDYFKATKNEKLVIYGNSGSNIHKYANRCDIPFVDIESGKAYKTNPLYDLYEYEVKSDGTAKLKKFYMNSLAKMSCLNVLPEIYGHKVTEIATGLIWYDYGMSIKIYNIEKIVLPSSVEKIPENMFKSDTYVKEVEFSDNVYSIEASAFKGCTNLEKISKLNNITEISDSTFSGCTSLKEMNIPNGVVKIGSNAFNSCKALKKINIPETVSSIGGYAFAGCESIEKFNIPKGVTALSKGLFKNCKSLKSMTIDDNITSLGGELFNNCTSLEEVYIPYTIKKFSKNIFDDCSSLGGIYVDSNNPVYSDLNGILVNKEKTKLICYPAGRTNKTYTVPNGITSFENGAFARANNLEKVIFQDGVESLSYELFYKNQGIKSVELSDSLKLIDDHAFIGCTSLEEITIPDSVTRIGSGAFYNCTSLKSITIPYSVSELLESTFYNCVSLEDVTLENVKKIGVFAFKGTKLKSIVLDTSVEEVCGRAFFDCRELTSVTCLNKNTILYKNSFGYVTDERTGESCRKGIIYINGYKGSTAENLTQIDILFRFVDIEASSTTTVPKAILPSKVTLNKRNVVLNRYSRNVTTALSAIVSPKNVTNKNIIWKTSNPKVARVDKNGKVTAISKGNCTITAVSSANSKLKATCKVTVVQRIVSVKLSVKNKAIRMGRSFTLKTTINPTNANNKMVTFKSSNTKVATVNSKGKVVGKKKGKTIITVTTKDGKKKARCIVKVK